MIDTSRTLTIQEVTEFRRMGQTTVEPQAAPSVEPNSNPLELALGSNYGARTYTGVQVGELLEISETAVRKIFNVVKQALPEDQLKVRGQYTELCYALMQECRKRPEGQTMAEWGHELVDMVKTLAPDEALSGSEAWEEDIKDARSKGALARTEASSELVSLQNWMATDEEYGDAAFEAELAMIADIEYGREVKRETVRIKARKQARLDIREAV